MLPDFKHSATWRTTYLDLNVAYWLQLLPWAFAIAVSTLEVTIVVAILSLTASLFSSETILSLLPLSQLWFRYLHNSHQRHLFSLKVGVCSCFNLVCAFCASFQFRKDLLRSIWHQCGRLWYILCKRLSNGLNNKNAVPFNHACHTSNSQCTLRLQSWYLVEYYLFRQSHTRYWNSKAVYPHSLFA